MGRKDSLKTITVGLRPEQYVALREEALRRAAQHGGAADASAIVRELVDAWMRRRKP